MNNQFGVFQRVDHKDIDMSDNLLHAMYEHLRHGGLYHMHGKFQENLKHCMERIISGDRLHAPTFFLEFGYSTPCEFIESVGYLLQKGPEPELEAMADDIISLLESAQMDDGYIGPYAQLGDITRRFTHVGHHELFFAGHLIEGACAYYIGSGKRRMLDIAIRFADLMARKFGPEGESLFIDVHEEVELALVKLYHCTGNRDYLRLAQHFISLKGKNLTFGWCPWVMGDEGELEYFQEDCRPEDICDAVGHAVRATYLYTAMADMLLETGDERYLPALERVYGSLTQRRGYITGGIGNRYENEGFDDDYKLPNDTSYCETCASCGMVFFTHRMNLYTGDAQYIDGLERVLYNAARAGISNDGKRYFYTNLHQSHGQVTRPDWQGCSCCPPNITRLLISVGNYIYARQPRAAVINLFAEGNAHIAMDSGVIKLRQATQYPWEGKVEIHIEDNQAGMCALRVRIPGWCRSVAFNLNGESIQPAIDKGYAVIERDWKAGDMLTLDMTMPIERCYAHPAVEANRGRVAIMRGPLVYCAEELDQPQKGEDFEGLSLKKDDALSSRHDPSLLGGVTVIQAGGITMIPYYAWDNRGQNRMMVWLIEK